MRSFSTFQFSQGSRHGEAYLRTIEADAARGAQPEDLRVESLRAALVDGLEHVYPSDWEQPFVDGFQQTLRNALAAVHRWQELHHRALSDAEMARDRAREAVRAASRKADAMEAAAREARDAVESAGARHTAYAMQRENDALKPLPQLYDGRVRPKPPGER